MVELVNHDAVWLIYIVVVLCYCYAFRVGCGELEDRHWLFQHTPTVAWCKSRTVPFVAALDYTTPNYKMKVNTSQAIVK